MAEPFVQRVVELVLDDGADVKESKQGCFDAPCSLLDANKHVAWVVVQDDEVEEVAVHILDVMCTGYMLSLTFSTHSNTVALPALLILGISIYRFKL